MELFNPELDNNPGGSWRSSGYTYSAPKPTVVLVGAESTQWHYRKGTSEPASNWTGHDYVEDGTWLAGQAGFGYGDSDDNTVLSDMRNYYTCVYLRHEFNIATQSDIRDKLQFKLHWTVLRKHYIAYELLHNLLL